MNTLDKYAVGAAGVDAEFEQSFFQLAYQKLQEKLHNLLPFLVGFEVIDKSEDGANAKGVFGFRSNNGQIVFVPAFFINGDVQGLDMFYSKNHEQFYPLTEDFAELFLKDDITGIGNAAKDTKEQVMRDMHFQDLRNMTTPPQTGRQSYAECRLDDLSDEDVLNMKALPKNTKTASLTSFLTKASDRTKDTFFKLMEKDANFCESVTRFYTPQEIAKSLVHHKKAAAPEPKVQVILPADLEKAAKLSLDEKQELLTRGHIILDKRAEEEKTRHGVFTFKDKFTNPGESGFYSYLTDLGTMRFGFVLMKPVELNSGFPSEDALVLDLDAKDKGQAYVVKSKNLFVKDQYKIKDFSQVHNMMEEAAEAKPSYRQSYILINENLKSSSPFRVVQNYKDGNGIRRIKIEMMKGDFHPCCSTDNREPQYHGNAYKKPSYPRTITLVFTKKSGDTLEYRGDMVFVPKGFKVLGIRSDGPSYPEYKAEDTQEQRDKKRIEHEKEMEEYKAGKPGPLSTLLGSLRERNVFPFTLHSNGSEYFLNIKDAKKEYKNPLEAKIALVLNVGLGEKEAEELIASVKPGRTINGFMKFAYTGDMTPYLLDNVPSTNVLGQQEYQPWTVENSLPTGDYYVGDPTRLGLGDKPETQGIEEAVQQATQMAQGGQKEIFDTHSIAALSKYTEPAEKVNEYMPDFVSALDKLGRMLFLIHADTNKFEEMYGRDELPELVELLTSVFNNLGDLVVFLKRKFPTVSVGNAEPTALNV